MRYINLEDLLKRRKKWGNRKELWRNPQLQTDFRAYFHNKCWYSEIKLLGQDSPIDHFRPKASVQQYKDYNYNRTLRDCGYYWLKNDPRNYRVSCIYANRKTHQGGKGCFFPLADQSEYLSEAGEEIEIPMLLDPCNEEDVKLLSFMGNTIISTSTNTFDCERVNVSAQIYNLTDPYTKLDINQTWYAVEKTIEEYKSQDISFASCVRQLKEYTDRSAQFSSCAIACVNSLAPSEIKAELDLEL